MESLRRALCQRYLETGIAGIMPQDAIELILSLTGTQDPIAVSRELFLKYKTIDKILNAKTPDLLKIKGLNEGGAELIGSLAFVFSSLNAAMTVGEQLNISENAEKYFAIQFENAPIEQFKFCCLDDVFMPLCCLTLGIGSGTGVSVSADKIISEAKKYRSLSVIIAHNHPSGSCFPSQSDLISTQALKNELEARNISLINHIICGVDGQFSMIK